MNGLPRGASLEVGDELQIVSHHVAPDPIEDGIVVNVPQRMLFVFEGGEVVGHYPVGIGRRGWTTPAGRYRIAEKERDPSWEVPRSIQAEMRDPLAEARRQADALGVASIVDWDMVREALHDRAGTAVAVGGGTVELDED